MPKIAKNRFFERFSISKGHFPPFWDLKTEDLQPRRRKNGTFGFWTPPFLTKTRIREIPKIARIPVDIEKTLKIDQKTAFLALFSAFFAKNKVHFSSISGDL